MAIVVPDQYRLGILEAAQHTGLSFAIVAAQAYVESGFNPGAVSPAGAEGFWQFLPSTFAAYGSGSPFNFNDETLAYINFMRALLQQFGGNVRNALAAYNAGPGNIGAGLGYADEIIALAPSVIPQIGTTGSPAPLPPQFAAPSPSEDDWSWYILKTGEHFYELSTTCGYWASYIGRL